MSRAKKHEEDDEDEDEEEGEEEEAAKQRRDTEKETEVHARQQRESPERENPERRHGRPEDTQRPTVCPLVEARLRKRLSRKKGPEKRNDETIREHIYTRNTRYICMYITQRKKIHSATPPAKSALPIILISFM